MIIKMRDKTRPNGKFRVEEVGADHYYIWKMAVAIKPLKQVLPAS